MKSEQRIQQEIMLALSKNDCIIFRSNAGKIQTKQGRWIQLAPRGWPDITGFYKPTGQAVLIEVKTPTGKLRDDQVNFAKIVEDLPVIYGVARSAEDAIEILKEKAVE